jgi:hypothetical protein
MQISTRPRLTVQATNRRARLMRLLATPVLLIALAGCATSAPDATDPSQGGGAGGSTEQPTTEAEFAAARDAYDLKLAQCFRDKGLDVKDPLPGVGITENNPEIQAAFPECAEEIGDPPTSENVKATPEDVARALAQAECLRELGYEIQEPTLDDIGFIPAEVTAEDFDTCRA